MLTTGLSLPEKLHFWFENMKKIVFAVTTDLNYDQRMQRICGSLALNGYQVLLVGREWNVSKPLIAQSYQQHRLKCIFQKGKFFYLEYNLRLFFYLLFGGACRASGRHEPMADLRNRLRGTDADRSAQHSSGSPLPLHFLLLSPGTGF